MSLLPKMQTLDIETNLDAQYPPLKTYRIGHAVMHGFIEGKEAVEQAVYKILRTERFAHLIYNWDYGVELDYLMGKEMQYVEADLKRRVEESLMQNIHIIGIQNFLCTILDNEAIAVSFMVLSTQGNIEIKELIDFENKNENI